MQYSVETHTHTVTGLSVFLGGEVYTQHVLICVFVCMVVIEAPIVMLMCAEPSLCVSTLNMLDCAVPCRAVSCCVVLCCAVQVTTVRVGDYNGCSLSGTARSKVSRGGGGQGEHTHTQHDTVTHTHVLGGPTCSCCCCPVLSCAPPVLLSPPPVLLSSCPPKHQVELDPDSQEASELRSWWSTEGQAANIQPLGVRG